MASETITRNDLTAILNSVLPNPADMTPQEVEDFVNSLLGQGSNIADFVVEEGTDGIWTYRKWESGIAECWCGTSKTATAAQTEFTLYYPSGLFTSVTAVTANGSVTGNINSGVRYTSTSTTYCDIWITAEVTGTATINVHTLGRWK